MLLSTIFYLCSLPSMQTVTPDNVCNIIHLTNRLSIPFPVFSHFLTAFSLYIPTNFMSVFL